MCLMEQMRKASTRVVVQVGYLTDRPDTSLPTFPLGWAQHVRDLSTVIVTMKGSSKATNARHTDAKSERITLHREFLLTGDQHLNHERMVPRKRRRRSHLLAVFNVRFDTWLVLKTGTLKAIQSSSERTPLGRARAFSLYKSFWINGWTTSKTVRTASCDSHQL